MPKSLLRIVSLILVPCLLANPVVAGAVTQRRLSVESVAKSRPFGKDALVAYLVNFRAAFSPHGKEIEVQRVEQETGAKAAANLALLPLGLHAQTVGEATHPVQHPHLLGLGVTLIALTATVGLSRWLFRRLQGDKNKNTLPDPVALPIEATKIQSLEEPTQPSRFSRKILVAEDDFGMQLVYETLLKELGFEVIIVSNGAHAWQKIRTEDFAALVTDAQMPGMDGEALIANVTQLKTAMPILLATGSDTIFQRVSGQKHAQVRVALKGPDEINRRLAELNERIALSVLGPADSVQIGNKLFTKSELAKQVENGSAHAHRGEKEWEWVLTASGGSAKESIPGDLSKKTRDPLLKRGLWAFALAMLMAFNHPAVAQNEWSIGVGGSNTTPEAISWTEGRRFAYLAVRYYHPISIHPNSRLDYVMEAMPMLIHEPHEEGQGWTFTNSDRLYDVNQRGTVPALGLFPLGVRWTLWPGKQFHPSISTHEGIVSSAVPVPYQIPGATDENFAFDLGFELGLPKGLSLEYLYYHTSNANRAVNPAIDANFFQINKRFATRPLRSIHWLPHFQHSSSNPQAVRGLSSSA